MKHFLLPLAALVFAAATAGPARVVPPLAHPVPNTASSETAVLAGGCFWGVEGVYEHVKGVKRVVSGYAGGTAASPTYEQVSGGGTGAAEAVRIDFDPRVVSYADLLRIYFSVVADPTLKNRQGPDVGSQYRTALFPVSKAQAQQARAYIAQLDGAGVYSRPIVTTIESGRFLAAEAYHQDYMKKHPDSAYIIVNDAPKLAALRKLMPGLAR